MSFYRRLSPKRKRVVLFSLYVVYLLLLIEVGSRGFWTIRHGVPFFSSEEIFYTFYPELRTVKQEQIHSEDGYIDILLLGGSVLNPRWGNIPTILQEELTYRTKKNIRIHNLAWEAHSSLDSYYKYNDLMDKDFDLVIFYHGINDVRANNIPDLYFKNDYSHYYWYERINAFRNHNEINLVVFPFTLRYLSSIISEKAGTSNHIPKGKPIEEWIKYGRDIKTSDSFEKNLTNILEIANSKNENVLLMTFAYYVPENYSKEKFKAKSLDYTLHRGEIEVWGKPENVVAGISVHNAIIEKVAKDYNNVTFVDQNALIPKDGQYFNDVVHFTHKGSEVFVDNILEVILEIISGTKVSFAG